MLRLLLVFSFLISAVIIYCVFGRLRSRSDDSNRRFLLFWAQAFGPWPFLIAALLVLAFMR